MTGFSAAAGGKPTTGLKNIFIVSTMDGKLRALDMDKDGEIVWILETWDPLLVSKGNIKAGVHQPREGDRWLVPSLDGYLCVLKGNNLEASVHVDSLLQKPLLNPNLALAGGGDTSTCAINARTLQAIYTADRTSSEPTDAYPKDNGDDVILVTRHSKTIRAVNNRTGSEMWAMTVGKCDVSYSRAETTKTSPLNTNKHLKPNYKLKVNMEKGIIVALEIRKDTEPYAWTAQFDSPIVSVWKIYDRNFSQVDLYDTRHILSNEHQPRQAPVMLSSFNGLFFVTHSDKVKLPNWLPADIFNVFRDSLVVTPKIEGSDGTAEQIAPASKTMSKDLFSELLNNRKSWADQSAETQPHCIVPDDEARKR